MRVGIWYLAGTTDGKRFLASHWPPIWEGQKDEWTPFPEHAYRFLNAQQIENFVRGREGLIAYCYETVTTPLRPWTCAYGLGID